MQRLVTTLTLLLLIASGQAIAKPFEMDVIETDDLRLLYFDPFQTYLVPHVVRNFHNSLDFQKKLYGWQPDEKTTVVLTDLSDYGNAGAAASPRNGVSVYIAPASRTLETIPSSERIFMLMNHEMVHVANMDMATKQDKSWRRLFGGKPRQTSKHPESMLYNYLTTPRLAVPRWYLEGAAVFMETWMSGGLGRAQGAFDEMVFRSMVRDQSEFYSSLGIVSEGIGVDFQTGVNAYLYGTRFFSYLALQYSPEDVVEWLRRGEGSERYYSKHFNKVFGLPLELAWQQWIAWEKQFQAENLRQVNNAPLTALQPLSEQTLGSISRSYVSPDGKHLIGAFRYPGQVAHVGKMDLQSGKVEHLTDIKGPMKYRVTSTAYDPAAGKLFFTADNNAYRDLMVVDVETGRSEMLIKDARIGDIALNSQDQSLWGLRHLNGYVSLVRIAPPYKEWNQLYTWPYGQVPYELDIAPDGSKVSMSLGEIDASQYLRVFNSADLAQGNPQPIAEFNFISSVPEGFVFSPDGKYLYGSSFYTGVSNLFRYEFETGDMQAVSNAETGLFRPIPQNDGSLIAFEYTGTGFVPSRLDGTVITDISAIKFLGNEIARKHPIVRDWNVIGTLAESEYESRITYRGKYRPYRELEYSAGYPIVEGYRDTVAVGWAMNFQDPAQLHNLNLSASWSIDGDFGDDGVAELEDDERLHFSAEYRALNWYAKYTHNRADFYDLFGPTERGRKGNAYHIGYERALIFDEPRVLDFNFELAHFTDLDTLPGNQNVSAFSFDELTHAEIGLDFTDTRKSLGAVDHEKGWRWNALASSDRVDGEGFNKLRVGLDAGIALPLKHSSLWLYSAAGTAGGDRQNPLSNFYFGSFGNNYVDDGEVKRYRQYHSMPGFEIDQIPARRFVKSVAEWNLPPKRFKSAGSPGFFLSWVRPAVFIAGLRAELDDGTEQSFSSAGLQLDLNFTVAHRHTMTLSAGYAVGYQGSRKNDSEFLLSLKIL